MQNWVNDPKTSAIFERAFVQVYGETTDYAHLWILERAKIV